MKKKGFFFIKDKNIIICLILIFLLILPSTIVMAEYEKNNLQNTNGQNSDSIITHSKGWKPLTDNGFDRITNLGTRGMKIYDDELYIGTHNIEFPKLFMNTFPGLLDTISHFVPNILPKFLQFNARFKILCRMAHEIPLLNLRAIIHFVVGKSEGCEIWKYNYSTDSLTQIVGEESTTGMKSGFDYKFNCMAGTFQEFKGKLYAGTWSTPLVNGGFGNVDNVAVFYMEVFKDYLYASTMNWDFTKNGGCEIWRSMDGIEWEQVVANGFKPNMSDEDLQNRVTNTYLWNMIEYQDYLYAGTFNSRYKLASNEGTGCQLWRTNNGITWEKVELPNGDGFGEKDLYGIRRMVVYNDELYIGTAANILHRKGCEIWKFDGINWTPIIADDVPGAKPTDKNYSGFGNSLNKYVWSMTVTSDNKIWVGTANGLFTNLMEPKSGGCEVWCYDGAEWNSVVKDVDNEMPSGFGDKKNVGARSIIEYPKGSGNVVVGTFKFISTRFLIPQEGMEVWMRVK